MKDRGIKIIICITVFMTILSGLYAYRFFFVSRGSITTLITLAGMTVVLPVFLYKEKRSTKKRDYAEIKKKTSKDLGFGIVIMTINFTRSVFSVFFGTHRDIVSLIMSAVLLIIFVTMFCLNKFSKKEKKDSTDDAKE